MSALVITLIVLGAIFYVFAGVIGYIKSYDYLSENSSMYEESDMFFAVCAGILWWLALIIACGIHASEHVSFDMLKLRRERKEELRQAEHNRQMALEDKKQQTIEASIRLLEAEGCKARVTVPDNS